MTDIHSHILPAADDGSSDWEMTLQMCQIAFDDGIRNIVATPHANHIYSYDRKKHSESVAKLQDLVPEIRFTLGCDFHLSDENVTDAIAHPERYVIGNSRFLLVEFSDFQLPDQMTETIFRLHAAGFVTIVSHPERNPIIEQYPDLPRKLYDMGSHIQITANALTGEWGRRPRKTCETLLRYGIVSFIASDAHDTKKRRPSLSKAHTAASRLLSSVDARLLVHDNPSTVLTN